MKGISNKVLSIAFASTVFCAGFSLFLGGVAIAEDEKSKEREIPRSGTLSSTVVAGGTESISVESNPGAEDVDIFTDQQAPITGSVFKSPSQSEWIARLFNNSESKYSVQVEVVQFDVNQKILKRDSFGITLNPGENSQRMISARANSQQATLNLKSARNLSPKKDVEAESESIASIE